MSRPRLDDGTVTRELSLVDALTRTVTRIGSRLALLLLFVVQVSACAPRGSALEVVGAVESVALVGEDVALDARIDTGAALCSLDAHSITAFDKDGARWVRFSVHRPDGAPAVELERSILRSVEVKRHGEPDDERHTVMLSLGLGASNSEVEVTLADRSNYEFPLLVGRDLLGGRYLVDVSRERIAGTADR